jgi:DNA polymerase I-like protein with 3'-5' exonuclease and polymerase domains
MVRDAMENVDRLAVPLVADVNWGEDWASAK